MFFTPHSGGVKRYLLAKKSWLHKNTSVRHTLLVPGTAGHDADLGLVRRPAIGLPFSHGYRFPLCKRAWVKALSNLRPDVIEVGDPYRLAWAALDGGRQLEVPVIGFYHSDTRGVLRTLMGAHAGPLIDRYVRHLYNRFDLVLAPSHSICRSLEEIGVERVARQPLGVDTAVFHPGRRDPRFRAQLGLPPEARLLVFAGRANGDKNIELLIDAVARLGKPYHLLLIGQRFRFDASSHVSCYPYQHDQKELARLLASSDTLVHAGDKETFGLVVIEAMASGIPAVALHNGPISELITEETGVLVDKADSANLAAGIEALFAQDLSRLGRNARAQVEKEWDWDALMPGLLDRYMNLARQRDLRLPQTDSVTRCSARAR